MACKLVTPRAWVVQHAYYVQQGRFSAAGRSHNGHKFPILNFEVNVVQCQSFYLFGPKTFFKILYLYHSKGFMRYIIDVLNCPFVTVLVKYFLILF